MRHVSYYFISQQWKQPLCVIIRKNVKGENLLNYVYNELPRIFLMFPTIEQVGRRNILHTKRKRLQFQILSYKFGGNKAENPFKNISKTIPFCYNSLEIPKL